MKRLRINIFNFGLSLFKGIRFNPLGNIIFYKGFSIKVNPITFYILYNASLSFAIISIYLHLSSIVYEINLFIQDPFLWLNNHFISMIITATLALLFHKIRLHFYSFYLNLIQLNFEDACKFVKRQIVLDIKDFLYLFIFFLSCVYLIDFWFVLPLYLLTLVFVCYICVLIIFYLVFIDIEFKIKHPVLSLVLFFICIIILVICLLLLHKYYYIMLANIKSYLLKMDSGEGDNGNPNNSSQGSSQPRGPWSDGPNQPGNGNNDVSFTNSGQTKKQTRAEERAERKKRKAEELAEERAERKKRKAEELVEKQAALLEEYKDVDKEELWKENRSLLSKIDIKFYKQKYEAENRDRTRLNKKLWRCKKNNSSETKHLELTKELEEVNRVITPDIHFQDKSHTARLSRIKKDYPSFFDKDGNNLEQSVKLRDHLKEKIQSYEKEKREKIESYEIEKIQRDAKNTSMINQKIKESAEKNSNPFGLPWHSSDNTNPTNPTASFDPFFGNINASYGNTSYNDNTSNPNPTNTNSTNTNPVNTNPTNPKDSFDISKFLDWNNFDNTTKTNCDNKVDSRNTSNSSSTSNTNDEYNPYPGHTKYGNTWWPSGSSKHNDSNSK